MSIKTNAGQVASKLEKNSRTLVVRMQKTMQKWGNSTIRKGKKEKPYKRRSGNLDRSQKAQVNGLTLKISIDPTLVNSKGFNYGTAQHDGTKNIKGEPWLTNAVDEHVDELVKDLTKDIMEVFK